MHEPKKCEPYGPRRLFDWTMAAALIITGVIILCYPKSIGNSAFHMILRLVTPYTLALIYISIGVGRLIALRLSDMPRYAENAANLRAAMSFASSLVWLQIIAAFVLIIPERGVPSPSLGLYTSLVLAEWYSTYRSAARG